MKYSYLLVISMMISIVVFTQPVTIGTGNLTTSNSPYSSYFSYSYSQTIYSKNEIAATGNINSISFNFAGTSLSYSDSITVYLGVVNKEFFNSATDWVPLSALTQVYKNQLTGYVVPGNITITLPVPFAYNGSGNLLIAIDENKPNRNSTVRYSGTPVTPANRVLFYGDNTNNPNPASPPTGILSNVIGNITINGLTISPCKNPITNVTVSNLSATGTTAVAKWSKLALAGQSPSQYLWEVRESGYTPADGTYGLVSSGNILDTTVALSGLNTSSFYTFFVKPLCGVASFGNWTSGTAFNTDCDAVNIPYFQDFSSSVNGSFPDCMTVESSDNFYEWDIYGGEANLSIAEPYYSSSFKTSGLNLKGGTAYRLKFKSVFSGVASLDEFRVNLDGSLMELLSSSNASYNPNDIYYTIDFIPTTSGIYKISFEGYSKSYYYSCTVDDISVTPSPACVEPLLYPATGISTTTATISWQSTIRPTTSYDVYISSVNTPPNASTIPSYPGIINTSFTFSNLSANTKYYYWVRANCGNNSYSAWSMSKNFTTLCQPINLPYAIDFEASGSLPECTSTMGYNEGFWTVNNDITGQSFRQLKFDYNYVDDYIKPYAWFYTRGLYLTAGITYNLSFRYSTYSYSPYESEIGAYFGNSYAAMNNVLAYYTITEVDGENISNTNFIPTTSGVYYLGFFGKTDPMNPFGDGAVYLDDIYVTQVSPCMEPKSILASNIKQTSAKIDWSMQSAGSTSYELYYSTNNLTPALNATPNQSGILSTTANISGLLQNTKYYVWVRSNCGAQGKSIWSVPASFTTLEAAGITSVTAAKNPICANTTTILTAIGVKGTNAVITWWTGPGGSGTNLGTGLFLTNRGAGTYYARVTASAGNPVEAMYRVTVYPGTGVSQSSVIICNSYTWNGVTYRQSGTYTFNTTTAGGCDSVATLQLTILSVASTFTKTDAGCYGSATGSIAVTPTSGTGPYTYRLGTVGSYSSVNTFTGLKAGSYRVSIIDATGCSGLTNSIIVSQSPAISATVVQSNINCYGAATGSFTLTGTNGTSPYTYRLGTTGSYTPINTFSNLKAGSYRVYILDAKGCGANVVVTLTQPAAPLSLATSKTDVICRGAATGVITATATGGTTPYTFKLGMNGTYVSAGTFAGLAAGTYTVYVLDAKGCTATSALFILQPVTAVTGTINKNDVKCYGLATGAISVTGTGGTSPYQYKSGSSGVYSSLNNFTGLKAGTYNMYVKDSVGCIFSTSTIVTQPSAISANYTKNDERCPGAKDGNIIVNGVGGTPPYTYRLGTTGAFGTNNTFTGLKAGSYRVYVSDANSCGNYSVAIIIAQKSTTCFAQSAIAKTDQPGKEKMGGLELNISPNPTSSRFALQVRTPREDNFTIRVLNVNGKTVYTSIGSPKQILRFGESLSAGVYLLEVRQGLDVKTVKAIKAK